MRNLHERVPERFLDERLISEIGGFEQLNQEELKFEREVKALEMRRWYVLLQFEECDGVKMVERRSVLKKNKKRFMFWRWKLFSWISEVILKEFSEGV